MDGRHQITYYPSTLTRESSYINLKNLDTNETSRFDAQEVVGKGTYGFVRRFSDGKTDLAVKAPNQAYVYSATEKEVEYRRLRLQTEFSLACYANPDNHLLYMTEVLGHDIAGALAGKPKYHFSWRIVDEFHPGKTLESYLTDYKFAMPADFAILLLRIAQALQKIHDQRVIHGDVADRNIMVEKEGADYKIKFIDFGLGYKLDGNAVVGFYNEDEYCELAPERINRKRLPADPAQDVFSLAMLAKNILKNNFRPYGQKQCKETFPCIEELIRFGTDTKPDKRPNLDVFIRKLRHQLEWRDLDKDLFIMATALENAKRQGYSKARALTEGFPSKYTGEKLAEFLTYLIDNNKFEVATNLLTFKKVSFGFLQLYAAISNPQTPEELLGEMIENIPKKTRKNLLNTTNFDQSTLLHTASNIGRLDHVYTLLDNGLNLLAEDNDGHKPADVAADDIKPMLQLLTWIAKHQQQNSKQYGKIFKPNDELMAATKLLELAHGEIDADEFQSHLEVVTGNRELQKIYSGLINYSFIEKETIGFLNGLNEIVGYFY